MLCSCRMALRACAAAVALRAYAAAEWRCRACGCLMALRLRACAAAEWRCRACGDRMALRAYAAAEWRWAACLMALRCATPLSARRPAAGVCGGRVALQGVRRPNGAADTMWARGSVQSYGDACELCFLKYRGRSAFV